jgi:hypothetical protein
MKARHGTARRLENGDDNNSNIMHLLALDAIAHAFGSSAASRRGLGVIRNESFGGAWLITWHWHVYRPDSDNTKDYSMDATRPHASSKMG